MGVLAMTLEMESESGLLKIDVERSRDQLVLSISGELDLATAPLLQEHLLEAAQAEVSEVVLDLEQATYIDSVGLGVLVSAHKRLATSGGELIIRSSPSRSLNLFEAAGLSSYLNLSHNRCAVKSTGAWVCHESQGVQGNGLS
jgi:stage II sporulation protein AA (anti-sigma F factor antagonist)